MKPIEHWQIKAIYALGSSVGIVERGNHDDTLHQMIRGLTGKESVTDLTDEEANQIVSDLKDRMHGNYKANNPRGTKTSGRASGGMTEGQQKKCWQLMYKLAEYDKSQSTASIGSRLCGIIKRQLHIDATPQQPYRWLNYQQGGQLIEILKKYVNSADQRTAREAKEG